MAKATLKPDGIVTECTNALNGIGESRREATEEYIDDMMRRRWFRPKTREQALERMKARNASGLVSEYDRIHKFRYGEQENHLKRLRSLAIAAQRAGSTITLDDTDIEVIGTIEP